MPRLRLDRVLDWKRAPGEPALIVCGALIALAVDSWWQGRRDRARETAYLEQLLVDLRETEGRLQESIAGDSGLIERVNSVVDRVFNGPLPPPDSLSLPTGYTPFRPLTGTAVALVRGGDLQLVHNDSLRFHIIGWVASIDAADVILRHTETLIWNSTERVLYGSTRHSRIRTASPAREALAFGSVDVAGILSDSDVISALRIQVAASTNRVRNLHRP